MAWRCVTQTPLISECLPVNTTSVLTFLSTLRLSCNSLLNQTPSKMPSTMHVNKALSLIENDKTKILGLTISNHQNIQPGQYVPRAGQSSAHRHPHPYELTNKIPRRRPRAPEDLLPGSISIQDLPPRQPGHRRPLPIMERPRPNPALDPARLQGQGH